jgi:transcriptional regulator with XRE-family HTH domain
MRTNTLLLSPTRSARLTARIAAIRQAMRQCGMTSVQIALGLGVSRQYVSVILRGKSYVSDAKLDEIEGLVSKWSTAQKSTAGQRLRAARLCAGLTLKEAADLIGYSWMAVERWEKDRCCPKPGVLWHLRHVYCVGEDWIPTNHDQRTRPPQSARSPSVLGPCNATSGTSLLSPRQTRWHQCRASDLFFIAGHYMAHAWPPGEV